MMSKDKQKVVAKAKEWEKARDDRRVLKQGRRGRSPYG
jgi:hypothetical protein